MADKETARLSDSFEIFIPKALRDSYKWHAGQTFAFIPREDGVLLSPARCGDNAQTGPERSDRSSRERRLMARS